MTGSPLAFAHPPTRAWFEASLGAPTRAQALGWPPISRGDSTVVLAPTGSGKTLAAFLVALDRCAFTAPPPGAGPVRVLYVSPLKALGVDVERNLRAPLEGLASEAARLGHPCHRPTVGVRTGDTPRGERARLARAPPDILITTPESLYLLLTSSASAALRGVETVIVDEIHALLPTKRGAHLALSLERLEQLRAPGLPPLQRIGLSATQRPPGEVARFLSGYDVPAGGGEPAPRPVTVVDAGTARRLELRVELPASEHAGNNPGEARSAWAAIHPRLVELIRAHRSTLIFTHSRRLAERLAGALNELAGESIARAHHGSVSREQRLQLEQQLKEGTLPALVATGTLELGVDMAAVELVIQVEAPQSTAAGLQRVGRAGHQVGGTSRGVVFPKHRSDLLACAAVTARMEAGTVEETRFVRRPLDVAVQQLVAAAATGTTDVEALWRMLRGAANYDQLTRELFNGLLDQATGQFPTHELADLRPSLTRDPDGRHVRPRAHAKRLALLNGGTIPERGLFGVFLAADGASGGASRRVGELDEEMVLEMRTGDVFVLGASSWRAEEMTHDRVLVSPAPGESGRMPFWRGEALGRAAELGEAVGALARELDGLTDEAATELLVRRSRLDAAAARALVAWLGSQRAATGEVPSDRTVVVERFRDEVGDWRVCVLSPFGARVHAPWAFAVQERLRAQVPGEVELVWGDDGFAFRLPELEVLPELSVLFPSPDEVEALVTAELASTSLFAARFRENAARALLLPRRYPGRRTPLWALRKRARDLLAATLRVPSFPVVLETYRECLRDAFDLPALQRLLARVASGEMRILHVETPRASPFAASLTFGWAQEFLYDGDLPPSERRARALVLDHARLRALLGEAEARGLFEAAELAATERALQRLEPRALAPEPEALHDLLWRLGDLSRAELQARVARPPGEVDAYLEELLRGGRALEVTVAGEARFVASEDAGRYRDALGLALPPGAPSVDPLAELALRYARTHGPFTSGELAARLGARPAAVDAALSRLEASGAVVLGAFRPGARGVEACEVEVLRTLKRRAQARLRKNVQPVDTAAWARFLADRHALVHPRAGPDGLLDAVEQLQGLALPASDLEEAILPSRVARYSPGLLDALCVSGDVLWQGLEALGESDGRVALYLSDQAPLLSPLRAPLEGPVHARVREALSRRGALRYDELLRAVGGFPPEVERALWDLAWNGEVTNDTLAPLRSRAQAAGASPGRHRRAFAPGTEGRWSLFPAPNPDATARLAAQASQALRRDGVVVREAVDGFGALYPVLKAMEDAGRARRGHFVEGMGAAQFSLPGTEERLRTFREAPATPPLLLLASVDPANPHGAALPWPRRPAARPMRAAGTRVLLAGGELCAWLGRKGRTLTLFSPDAADAVARALGAAVDAGRLPALLLEEVDGAPARDAPQVAAFLAQGFSSTEAGLLRRRKAILPDPE